MAKIFPDKFSHFRMDRPSKYRECPKLSIKVKASSIELKQPILSTFNLKGHCQEKTYEDLSLPWYEIAPWTKDFWQFVQKTKRRVSAVRATVARPLAYRGRHSAKWKWIRGRVKAKSAGSGEPVFTSMDALLYEP
jgi:hypothetical protein